MFEMQNQVSSSMQYTFFGTVLCSLRNYSKTGAVEIDHYFTSKNLQSKVYILKKEKQRKTIKNKQKSLHTI